jgi:hypothetical protein
MAGHSDHRADHDVLGGHLPDYRDDLGGGRAGGGAGTDGAVRSAGVALLVATADGAEVAILVLVAALWVAVLLGDRRLVLADSVASRSCT